MQKTRFLLPLFAIFAVIASTAVSASAQDSSGLGSGIASWSGDSRGFISSLNSTSSTIELSAVLSNPGSSEAIDYQILENGIIMRDRTSTRPSSTGAPVAIITTFTVDPGIHEFCLRLDDKDGKPREADCTTAATVSPSGGASNALINNATGVVVSPSGVVVPVVDGTTNNWQVTTPCGATTTLRSGTFIQRAQVVIDPGHGGDESGAAAGGLVEKNLNLAVTELVVNKFEELGISAMTTRTGDYRLPIQTRADIATALAADVFISIHHNGGAVSHSSTPGTEIYYSEARPESQRLAAIMFEEMTAAASQFNANWVSTINQGASLRLREEGDDLYGIHRYSPQIDSVLTEFMYLSNPSEAALLARPEVLEAQAQAIVDGVLRWWFEDDTGTTLGRRFVLGSTGSTGGFDSCTDPSLTSGTVGTVGLNNLSLPSLND